MKKKRYSVLINIATICLCVCAIAVGVYAAKSASITASGTVGFTANNATFNLKGTVVDSSSIESGANQRTRYFNSNGGLTTTESTISVNSSEEFGLGILNFNDLLTTGNKITITLEIENTSAYGVGVTMTAEPTAPTGVTKSVKVGSETGTTLAVNSTQYLTTENGSAGSGTDYIKIVITYTLDTDATTFDATAFSLAFKIEKGEPLYSVVDFGTNGNMSLVNLPALGKRLSVKMGKVGTQDIHWIAIAKQNGSTWGKHSGVDAQGQIVSGNYYFISLPVTKVSIPFDSNGSYVYEDSGIRTYLTGTATGSLKGDLQIADNDPIYSQIIPRTAFTNVSLKGNPTTSGTTGNTWTMPADSTGDKFWLLSEQETTTFLTTYNERKTYRYDVNGKNNTTYAYQTSGADTSGEGWLRSPYNTNVWDVDISGRLGSNYARIAYEWFGVRAAFQIQI